MSTLMRDILSDKKARNPEKLDNRALNGENFIPWED